MMLRVNRNNSLGLEWLGSHLKAAKLTMHQGKVQLDHLYLLPRTEEYHCDATVKISDEERLLVDISKKLLTATCLPINSTLVRQIAIPLTKDGDIDAALPFQVEPLLPYPLENALIDRVISERSPNTTDLTLFIARKDHVALHLQQWRGCDIEPEMVSCVPVALAAFGGLMTSTADPYFILHLGFDQICCVFIRQQKVIAAQATAQSLSYLKLALAKEENIEDGETLNSAFDNFNWNSLSADKMPKLASALEHLRREVSRIVFSLVKQTKELAMPQLMLTGEGAASSSLAQMLTQQLQKNLLEPTPSIISSLPITQLLANAIPIGAAATALPGYRDQVNFRQQEYAYPFPWRHLKIPLAIYFTSGLFLAAALFNFGQSYFGLREEALRFNYAELLKSMNKPYEAVESAFVKVSSDNGRNDSADAFQPIISLSVDDLQARLSFLEKEINASPDLFPLLPQLPRISDLLSWLSTLPEVVGPQDDKPLIVLEAFNYTLVKRPEIKKMREKYQARVELQFSSRSATAAREFHDILISDNPFVDPASGVKWSSTGERYKAIFVLKDKTEYF